VRIALLTLDPEVALGATGRTSGRLMGCAAALLRQGHDVCLLASTCPAQERERLERRGFHLGLVPPHATPRAVQNALGLVRPDLVIEYRSPGPPRGARAAAALGAIHVYDIHDLPPVAHGAAVNADSAADADAWGAEWESSHAAVVPSATVASRLRAVSPAGYPVRVVPPGIEPFFLSPPAVDAFERAGRALRSFHGLRVGCVGGSPSSDALAALVRAIGKVPSARRIQLAWIGDGPARNALLMAAHASGVPLALTGAVPREELPAYLAHLDVVAFPCPEASDELDGIGVLEAMAAGRPVLAPAIEPFGSIVRHGVDGMLATMADEVGLTETMTRLAASGRLRAEIGREARRAASKVRTWDTVVAEVVEFARESAGAAEDVG
jgi:glycosyltransferase involved in cell wall biosynthesis